VTIILLTALKDGLLIYNSSIQYFGIYYMVVNSINVLNAMYYIFKIL